MIESAGASVVHVHTFASQVLGVRAALRAGLPVVRTDHSTRAYVDPSCWPFSRWALARTSAVACVSRHVRGVAVARFPRCAHKTRVILPGVDVARFAPRPLPRPRPGRFAVLARLDPRKGVDVALRALAQVPQATLDIAGAGVERDKLERLALALGVANRTHFHGFVEDPRPILADCQAILCSSREEGLGVAYLEAMAMERPLLGFPTGGVPEIVKDGETGLLTREATPQALAARMRDALESPERTRELGRQARAYVVRHASVASMCEGYAEVYEALLARARPRR